MSTPAALASSAPTRGRRTWPVSVCRVLLDLLLVVYIGLVVGLGIAARVGPFVDRELLAISSGSMEPAIPVGALIVLDRGTAPVVGDVMTYRLPSGTAVTHRVTRVVERRDGRYFETKGDANSQADPVLIPEYAVVGTVWTVVPWLGLLLVMLGLPTGLVAILAVAGVLVAGLWLLDDLTRSGGD